MAQITRRRLLASTGGGALGLALGGSGFALGRHEVPDASRGSAASTVPFHGAHQAGIVTPAQDRLVFGAFDLTIDSAGELRELMQTWTQAAVAMTAGRTTGTLAQDAGAPPPDTGEAVGLPAAQLTITFGLGASVFTRDGKDRFGLAARRPAALTPLGPLPGEQLDPQISDGDLCVQACANDPQVAFHAVRNLARLARGSAVLRWTQLGFGRTSSTTSDQVTLRNLQGFKDGTNNLRGDDEQAMRRFVWVDAREPQRWLHGGTYLVSRRIRMFIESWDRDTLSDQEQVIGRFKTSGAPLNGKREHDAVDLAARDASGEYLIPADAHIRLAAPASNGGERILRRGYSFTDGIDPKTGELDAGLFFICFQRDPHRQFAAIQRRLGAADALDEYIQHRSSALFAILPGVRRGGYLAEGLLGG
ncbi:MAG TPA: iron uptake transporter deferrochelatase/peroxidase subunit [Solirubrobacteraceae bacterium]|nr:iron uptake transporter deferrochelatase/peroxidase subunit [Solirubrobacteraceae bacterium]